MSRWAMAEYGAGRVRYRALDARGAPDGPVRTAPSAAEAVRAQPAAERWVWRSTAALAPALLDAGVQVSRAHDTEAAEALLLGYTGRFGEPRSLAAAWARLHHRPVPPDPPAPSAPDSAQESLFDAAPPPLPAEADPLAALVEVHAAQLRAVAGTEHPERMRLLLAAESAGTLVAAEIGRAGLPWRADVHRSLLDELLGEQTGGLEPRRLTQLAGEVSAAFGRPVRPDLPAEVITAFREAGYSVRSTRSWELREIAHPAVGPLLEYKRLYRIHTAHGRGWLRSWVRDGRFRSVYVPGGAASGRWTTQGGGALQIPRVLRRAVRAEPGWRLVVADAGQLEPRVLAAMSRDRGLMEVAADPGDLYTAVSRQLFSGDREQAKLAVLGAVYGQTSGDGPRHLAGLRRRFPAAVETVDAAAQAGERGELVRTHLGRTCPPVGDPVGQDAERPDFAGSSEVAGATDAASRARGRFTRNFVVQGSAADWALLMLAALRRELTGMRAELVFFQHDEVIVHCPAEEAEAAARAVGESADVAGRLTFGDTPVRFPFGVAVVDSYDQAR